MQHGTDHRHHDRRAGPVARHIGDDEREAMASSSRRCSSRRRGGWCDSRDERPSDGWAVRQRQELLHEPGARQLTVEAVAALSPVFRALQLVVVLLRLEMSRRNAPKKRPFSLYRGRDRELDRNSAPSGAVR